MGTGLLLFLIERVHNAYEIGWKFWIPLLFIVLPPMVGLFVWAVLIFLAKTFFAFWAFLSTRKNH
jgi:hypothetical protein